MVRLCSDRPGARAPRVRRLLRCREHRRPDAVQPEVEGRSACEWVKAPDASSCCIRQEPGRITLQILPMLCAASTIPSGTGLHQSCRINVPRCQRPCQQLAKYSLRSRTEQAMHAKHCACPQSESQCRDPVLGLPAEAPHESEEVRYVPY